MLQVSTPLVSATPVFGHPIERANGEFNWVESLCRKLAMQGLSVSKPRQQTPANAVLGYQIPLAFQDRDMTLSTTLGEDDRLVLRLVVTALDGEVLMAYSLHMPEVASVSDTTWDQFHAALQKRQSSFEVFSKLLAKSLSLAKPLQH